MAENKDQWRKVQQQQTLHNIDNVLQAECWDPENDDAPLVFNPQEYYPQDSFVHFIYFLYVLICFSMNRVCSNA